MLQITVEELINYKILPFNIYTKGDKILFPAGEVLTPGKFLQLRHLDVIYRKPEEENKAPEKEAQKQQAPPESSEETEPQSNLEEQDNSAISKVDIRNVLTPINKTSIIPPEEQIKLKVFYDNTVGDITKTQPDEILFRMKELRDKIQRDYAQMCENATYSSQLRLVGEYDKCHAINVAILTAALARRLGYSEDSISDITLAALLHDIGKVCLPKTLTEKSNMTIQEQKLYQAHTKIGYNLIKNNMKLNDRIAKVALEHHEKNDGTGFPYGKSGDSISQESQIIAVCNFFDNLTFNKTNHKVHNVKEAIKILLEMGSKYFSTNILYTFIYMYNYDDTKPFDEITLG